MALRIEDVLEMWKSDSEIDDMRLDDAAKECANLHAKYLEMLSTAKLQLRRKESEYKVLLKNKWLWYNGKMSKDQMDSLGWDYDPLGGLKVMKGDMDKFYDADEDIQNMKLKVDYLKELVSTLEEIISNIRFRPNNIKNIIEWKKFTSGI